MAKRTIQGQDYQLDSDGNPPWVDPATDPFRPDPREYVSVLIDGGPFERLLWREIRQIERWTKMTEWQSSVFECYLRGLSIRETAALHQCPVSTTQSRLAAAVARAERYPHRGLFTVSIETLGWPVIREMLADRLEALLRAKARARRN